MLRFALVVLVVASSFSALASPRDSICPRGSKQRTPEQVLADHRAALAAGNVELDVQCNYASDAVVISDQGVVEGREAIAAALTGLVAFFGGALPVVHEEVVVSILKPGTHMVRLLFSVDTPCVAVPDGIDTYVIRNGQIHAQTAHGFPVFKCAPPPL